MELENMTEEELELLGANVTDEEIEQELDEYKEYNDKLIGTPYLFGYKGLQRKVKKGNNEEYKTLSNFMPIPVKKIYKDNGMEQEGLLEIEAVLWNKIKLKPIKVDYKKLENMSWIYDPKWGLYPTVYPPKSNHKEYVYDAILAQTKDIASKTIFEHTGFRKVNGELVYLYQGGAIGSKKESSVDLSEIGLEKYNFTNKKYDLKECIEESYSLLKLAKDEITIPLQALTYVSPLRSIFLKAGIPMGYVTWIVGESGSQKSTISAIYTSHFGDFERDTLPGGFKDTTNSIEKKAFTLKDTLFPIDDYYPSQTLQETKRMDAVAESLFGLYGDRQARSRMRQDGRTVKMGFSARGMCLVTGESFPTFAESRTARALIIDISRGDIDLNLLAQTQKEKEKLAFCMMGYIQFLIDNMDRIDKECKEKFIEYREKANIGLAHGRIPEIIAIEYIGMEYFLEFVEVNGVISKYEKEEELNKTWNTLIKVAKNQSLKTTEYRTDNMFFRGVQELLASKKIYLKDYKRYAEEGDRAYETFVGYYNREADRCYLLPNVIYNEVVKFYSVQGNKFPGNATSTWKYLKEAGRLFPGESGRNTTRKTINGKLVTFVEVMASDVFGENERLPGDYLSRFDVESTANHSNFSVDDMELPF